MPISWLQIGNNFHLVNIRLFMSPEDNQLLFIALLLSFRNSLSLGTTFIFQLFSILLSSMNFFFIPFLSDRKNKYSTWIHTCFPLQPYCFKINPTYIYLQTAIVQCHSTLIHADPMRSISKNLGYSSLQGVVITPLGNTGLCTKKYKNVMLKAKQHNKIHR